MTEENIDLLVVPSRDVYPTSIEFWSLVDRGWFLYLDERGKILGYIPPNPPATPIFKTISEVLLELKLEGR